MSHGAETTELRGREAPAGTGAAGSAGERPGLLCLAASFAPVTTPTAIRASKLLGRLAHEWDVTVLTETPGAAREGQMRIELVPGTRPARLLSALHKLRLSKLVELLVWPDESIFWVLAAVRAGRRLTRERRPAAILVFMMPYSAGIAGLLLARITRLPLVLNLDDSLTCTDMHPSFPTRLHYQLARRLEDLYVRRADAVVYVSQTNLDAVAARTPARLREKLHLVRYGADPEDFRGGRAQSDGLEIVYVGAMSGWWPLVSAHESAGALRRAYKRWTGLGRYQRTRLDHRTSSPAVAGQAILELLAAHPAWSGRVHLMVYGNPYDQTVVARALEGAGVQEVVTVEGPRPHAEVAGLIADADLLFITLPNRLDGSAGGRISAKTYEYLMTDRPILAAVPRGENWSYLEGKPGVWLVAPDDRHAMARVIGELAAAKFQGAPRLFDRSALRAGLSYDARADELAAVIRAAITPRCGRS
jgi:Glycosyltransferase Family 4